MLCFKELKAFRTIAPVQWLTMPAPSVNTRNCINVKQGDAEYEAADAANPPGKNSQKTTLTLTTGEVSGRVQMKIMEYLAVTSFFSPSVL